MVYQRVGNGEVIGSWKNCLDSPEKSQAGPIRIAINHANVDDLWHVKELMFMDHLSKPRYHPKRLPIAGKSHSFLAHDMIYPWKNPLWCRVASNHPSFTSQHISYQPSHLSLDRNSCGLSWGRLSLTKSWNIRLLTSFDAVLSGWQPGASLGPRTSLPKGC